MDCNSHFPAHDFFKNGNQSYKRNLVFKILNKSLIEHYSYFGCIYYVILSKAAQS